MSRISWCSWDRTRSLENSSGDINHQCPVALIIAWKLYLNFLWKLRLGLFTKFGWFLTLVFKIAICTVLKSFSVAQTNRFDRWERTACSSELPPAKGLRMHGAARWQSDKRGERKKKITSNESQVINTLRERHWSRNSNWFVYREVTWDGCRNSISDVYRQDAALTFCAGVIHEKLMGLHDWCGCHSHIYTATHTHTQAANSGWKARALRPPRDFGFRVPVGSPRHSTKQASCSPGEAGTLVTRVQTNRNTQQHNTTTQSLPFGWSACCISGVSEQPNISTKQRR